jgi:signal peptide peptidase SppA
MNILLQAFINQPWALSPRVMESMADILFRHGEGVRLDALAISAAIGVAPQRASERRESAGSLQVIPVYGILSHRAHMVEKISGPGGTSTEKLGAQIDAAAKDPGVSAIILDIDSPGGSVFGVQEVAETIRSARETKPVVAVANAEAASGAYWIASQASEFVVTPSGQVGSVGVYGMHIDQSAFNEKLGVKSTYIYAGKYKVEGNPGEPLGDEALAYEQSVVNDYYSRFLADIAKGRNVPVSTVSDGFGQGRMMTAQAAMNAGMVDRIDTLENTINRYRPRQKTNAMRAALL